MQKEPAPSEKPRLVDPGDSPLAVLKRVYAYPAFRPFQEDIISSVLEGRDLVAVMPTGGGKSICYQIPALLLDGLTLVVSPLIALMQDQVGFLNELGIGAVLLNSSLSPEDYEENVVRLRSGRAKILYAAPETLSTPRMRSLLAGLELSFIAVDEAHCISEWGHDFRVDYRRLGELRELFPDAVCLALTATATDKVRDDICLHLGIPRENQIVTGFNRPNLHLEVSPKSKPDEQMLAYLRRFPDEAGIVYCLSRQTVDRVADLLQRKGLSALPYHAGLRDDVRRKNQFLFIRDEVRIMVATVAFGMGIDKPNVRFVLHYDLPKSLENYYQEVGRAGRDGLPSFGMLLYSYQDVRKLRFVAQNDEGPDPGFEQRLGAMVNYAESEECRRKILLAHFGETFDPDDCTGCDNCGREHEEESDLTVVAHKFLSCVKRSGERFGATYVTDVLLGSKSQKILERGHQDLSTYGIGKEYSRSQWLALARLLERQGFVRKDEDYGGLSLTPKAYDTFRQKTPVLGIMPKATEKAAPVKSLSPADPAQNLDSQLGQELARALKAKRIELSRAAKVPPYVIFSDRTLIELVAKRPRQLADLYDIFGLGRVKIERYGDAILSCIGGVV